jgi:uncharacterized phage protein gp47/JayE
MPTFGINPEYGFYMPNLSEVLEDNQTDLKNEYGDQLNLSDNSYFGMAAKVQAGREFKVWQQLQSVYYSQTKNGAEGIFLDEIAATQGVIRNGKTFGTGDVVIEVDKTSDDIAEIVIGTTFNTLAGTQYTSVTSRTMSDYVIGYKIEGATLTVGTYTLTVTNSNNLTSSITAALVSNSDADRLVFFNNLKAFFDSALPNDTATILINTEAGKVGFYVGFNLVLTDYLLSGTTSVFKLKQGVNRIGNRFSRSAVIAVEKGYFPLSSGNIKSILPTPTGYVSVTNIAQFFSGSDVETDSAFSIRTEQQSDAPNTGTKPAILAELLAIPEVVGADLDKVVSPTTGVVTVEPILFGGFPEDIARVLYNTQPVNNHYIGDISYSITTEDGKVEVIKFTYGTDLNLSVRISYKPLNGIPLTTNEKILMQEAIESINGSLSAGSAVFNGQLAGLVFDVNPKRFIKLIIEVKLETDNESLYTDEDYLPSAFVSPRPPAVIFSRELPRLAASRVEIVQVA